MKTTGVAIIGCGNISNAYADTLKPYQSIKLVGAADLDPQRAVAFADKHQCRAYASLDELLGDDSVQIVINLTIHSAHYEVISRCLRGGKHVHTEKPLAMTYAEARELVDLADSLGLRLSCAPIVFMGEAQQTAMKMIREDKLGNVRLAYAEVNWGRIEEWHPNPVPFYEVGPVFDVAVYPLTILSSIFGPAVRVTSFGTTLLPDRVTKDGEPFHLTAPDYSVSSIEYANGAIARITANFYVTGKSKQPGGIEFHGDVASLYMKSWMHFDSTLEFAKFSEEYTPVKPLRTPYKGCEWARGVTELAEAIEENRPHRASAAQAAHVVETICAIHQSIRENRAVEVTSTFTPPAPMDWANT
jgi:predicted dehydrogenase